MVEREERETAFTSPYEDSMVKTNYLPNAPPSIIIMLGIRASTYGFGGWTIQSIAVGIVARTWLILQ